MVNNLKKILLDLLKGQAVKLALKKLLGSAMVGGPKAWLIKFIVTELFEEIAEPFIRYALNQVGYYYDKIDGEVKIKKLDRARENNNEQDYNATIDDILS